MRCVLSDFPQKCDEAFVAEGHRVHQMYSDVHMPDDASPVLSQADVTDVLAMPEPPPSALHA